MSGSILRNAEPTVPVNQYTAVAGEIDLRALLVILWRAKWVIAGIPLLVGVVAVAVVLRMPNVYKSEALLAPAEESSGGGIAALAGQLGGLASLAGVNLRKDEASKVTIGLAVLKSRLFITGFVERRDILVPLLATKKWDSAAGKLVLDQEIYQVETGRWIDKNADDGYAEKKPSIWKAYNAFSEIMQVNQAKDTGLITISISHQSPVLAKQWVDWLVEDVNTQLRQRDIEEAHKSIEYLKKQLAQTPLAGMQQIFYQLVEKQMQTIMLANVRDEYVFKVIDPPPVPEEKTSPRRGVIVVLSVMVSLVLVVAAVLVTDAFKRASTIKQ